MPTSAARAVALATPQALFSLFRTMRRAVGASAFLSGRDTIHTFSRSVVNGALDDSESGQAPHASCSDDRDYLRDPAPVPKVEQPLQRFRGSGGTTP